MQQVLLVELASRERLDLAEDRLLPALDTGEWSVEPKTLLLAPMPKC